MGDRRALRNPRTRSILDPRALVFFFFFGRGGGGGGGKGGRGWARSCAKEKSSEVENAIDTAAELVRMLGSARPLLCFFVLFFLIEIVMKLYATVLILLCIFKDL